MKTKYIRSVVSALAFTVCNQNYAAIAASSTITKEQATQALTSLSVPFEENRGQADAKVAFQAKTLAGPLFVTKTGELVWSLTPPSPNKPERAKSLSKQPSPTQFVGPPQPSYSVVEKFVGGTPQPAGATQSKTQVSYFHGNDRSKWQNSVPTWNQISLGQVWPGIEVSLAARGKNAEKLFTVAPGADASKIAIEVKGGNLAVAKDGGLNVIPPSSRGRARVGVETIAKSEPPSQPSPLKGEGVLKFTAPVAWQEINGERKPVTVAYRLAAANQYGFTLGAHDATQPVVIDPLIQSTYLGGSDYDWINAIAVTADAVYVAGSTSSSDFPGTSGGAQVSISGNACYDSTYHPCPDAFVAKLSLDLKALIQSTYLGGSGNDVANALAVTSDAVYVAGNTDSKVFPGTSGGAQAACVVYNSSSYYGNYCYEVFVAKLSLDLKSLTQSTYLGGNMGDYANALAVTSNAVYVAGDTEGNFPGTSGGAQANHTSNSNDVQPDGFVAKLALDLKSLTQSTYLGGSKDDYVNALVVTSNAVYVAGYTLSSNFPINGGVQILFSGYSDAFVAKLSLDLKSFTQSTYLGGSSQEAANALAVTSSAVYVTGVTDSSNFPGTSGGAQASISGICGTSPNTYPCSDAFVAKLSLDLKSLTQASYLGGTNYEGYTDGIGNSLAVTSNAVYVAGYTDSSNFPGTSGGAQAAKGADSCSYPPCSDVFVAKLSLDLKSLTQSTYLGGGSYENTNALAVTSNAVYVAGYTDSSNFPVTSGGAQASISGNACGNNSYPCSDGFVAKLSPDLRAISAPSVSTDAPSVITQTSAKLNGTVNATGAVTTVTFDFGLTTSYGTSIAATPASIAALTTAAVSADKTSLTCGTTYHYRVKAVNSYGTTLGTDKAFTTSACIPDFIITNAVLTPAMPVLNTNFSIAVTLKNQGSLAKDGGQLRLWLNQPTAQPCAATGGDKNLAVGTVAVGASKTLTFTGLNLASIGMRTLRTFVDATCAAAESNEINNQLIKSYRITGTGTRQADLSVTAIVLTPTTPAANGMFSAAVTVQNLGTAASTNAFLDVWANSTTAATCGANGNAWADVGAIAAGATTTVTVNGIPAGVAGSKTLRAFVDSWCEVVESNETNNQMTKAYTVQ